MVKNRVEVIASDDVTGNYKIRAGRATLTGTYDNQKMATAIEIQGAVKYSDLELLRFMQRINLDYVGVIRLVDEITLIRTIDTIGRIITIDDILKIGVIVDASIYPNLINNGSFETGDLAGWESDIGFAESTDVPTKKYAASIPATGYLVQFLPPYFGNHLKLNFLIKAPAATNIPIYLVFTDGTIEDLTQATTVPIWYPFTVMGTVKKRVKQIQFGEAASPAFLIDEIKAFVDENDANSNLMNQLYTGATAYDARQIRALTTADAVTASIAPAQSINVGTVTTLPAVSLADAENRVLPKAKGKTTIVKSAERAGGAGSSTIYTVTTGKTFYLTAANLFSPAAGSGKDWLQVDTGGDGTFRNLLSDYLLTSALITALVGSSSLSLAVPMPFSAGTVFRVTTDSANTVAEGSIVGWEE